MIGFKLSATSTTNFTYSYDHYTEGDFWIADAITAMSKIPGLGYGGKIIGQGGKNKDAINASLSLLSKSYLIQLGDVRNQMGVTVEGVGGTYLAHGLFNINGISGVEMVQRFVMALKRASDVYNQDIGDQVMTQITKVIKKFDNSLPFPSYGALWIEIDF
ncbi:MAG TPA: hypothetical protein PKE69_26605 [Pyrinomonadaceae bacterium]|nr:hypothetical protein [Pyrinomonadaceae bacterium]